MDIDTQNYMRLIQALSNNQNIQTDKNAATQTTLQSSSFSDIYQKTIQPSFQPTQMDGIFNKAAAEYNLPVNLLKAVAKAESNFNPNAVSSSGAVGVMQLMPKTAESLGVTNPYDPQQNIMGGAQYLRKMLDTFEGDIELTLAAYNAGPGNVKKYGGIPPFEQTQNYVPKVLAYAGEAIDLPAQSIGSTGNMGYMGMTGYTGNAENDFNQSLDASSALKALELISLARQNSVLSMLGSLSEKNG